MAQPFNLQKNLIVNASGNMMCIDARQPFTIKINTIYGNGNNTFALPLTNNTTNLKIETSDGQLITITNYADTAKLIQFPSAGIYTIKMRGECGWSFNNTGDCQKLTGISNWGRLKFNYLVGAFTGCINIGLNEGLPTNGGIYAPNVTSLHLAFAACSLSRVDVELLYLCTNVTIATSAFATNFITNIPTGFLYKMPKLISIYGLFYNNRLTNLKSDLLTFNLALTNVQESFSINRITSIGENLFYENKLITNYNAVFQNALYPGCIMPTVMFDLTQLQKVTTLNRLFYHSSTTNSPTGTVQDIWNYASPTVIKTLAFGNCTGLSNYASIPNSWKIL